MLYTPGSQDSARTLSWVLASGRWIHADGELVVVSEVANPELRGELYRSSVGSGVGSRESGVGKNTATRDSFDAFGVVRQGQRVARVHDGHLFTVYELDGAVVVLHRLEPGNIDNDIAELIAGELVRPGYVAVPRAFERCFAGVVLSSAPCSRQAWRVFYDNTLSGLRWVAAGLYPGHDPGPIATFGRIYEHARALVAGSSLLDAGTCFGFFPLLLQRSAPRMKIAALDLSAPMLELARDAAGSMSPAGNVEFVCGDARELPFADGSFDTVTALHVLEHLEPSSASRALEEMCRVARRRVIIAVPLEKEADPAYGHVQSFDREALVELGEKTGWRCSFEEYLGGWLVLEPV